MRLAFPINLLAHILQTVLAREHPARLLPAAAVQWRTFEYLHHCRGVVHAGVVWIVRGNRMGKNIRSGTPCRQPLHKRFVGVRRKVGRLGRPLKIARRFVPETQDKNALSVLGNAVVFGIDDLRIKNGISRFGCHAIKLAQIALMAGPKQSGNVLNNERPGAQSF